MAFVAVPSAVKVTLVGTYGAAIWNNIMYLSYTGGPPSSSDLGALGTNIGGAWNTNIAPLCSTSIGLVSVDCLDVGTDSGLDVNTSAAHPGTRAGTALTAQTACCVSWRVTQRWRGGHIRSYMPLGVLADITGNKQWLNTSITAFTSGVAGFKNALNAFTVSGHNFAMVGVRKKHDGGAVFDPPIKLPIVDFIIHGRVDTQRRRLGRELG